MLNRGNTTLNKKGNSFSNIGDRAFKTALKRYKTVLKNILYIFIKPIERSLIFKKLSIIAGPARVTVAIEEV